MKKTVICLLGPTCSGKTDLALGLYEDLPVDIISVDSVMIYRGMDIGSAKPDLATRERVPHQLIDIRDPSEGYSAGDFCVDATRLIALSFEQGRQPLLVGGTMLYFNALQQGIANLPKKEEAVRTALAARLEKEGLASLHEELRKIDPACASKIHANDPQRTLRALEVFYLSGKTMSAWWEEAAESSLAWPCLNIALIPDRPDLADKIALRFRQMLREGLVEEVEALYRRGDLSLTLPAIKSVGYKQVWQYLEGTLAYDEMIERAVIATRQLAKRQFTWLRRWPNLHSISSDDPKLKEKVLKLIS